MNIPALLAAALVFIFAAGDATAQGGPKYGTKEIAEGVYHFEYKGTNGMFVVADDGVLVLDPLSPGAAPVYLAEIRKVTPKPIKYLVYSHAHVDRIAGGKPFKDQGALIVAHEAVLPRLRMLNDPEIVWPDTTFADRTSIPLKGKRIELMHYGAIHGPGYTFLFLPDEKVLSAIDTTSPGLCWPPCGKTTRVRCDLTIEKPAWKLSLRYRPEFLQASAAGADHLGDRAVHAQLTL